MVTSRTLNPLHFEDLEPHRFEDLIRQLVYDLRPWHELQAIGRSGSDEGIDILGVERVVSEAPAPDDDEDLDQPSSGEYEDRTWVIQCKRKRRMPPSKVRSAVATSLRSFDKPPYGFILAAAADFSSKARETFRREMHEHDIQEFTIWGNAELEDKLFEPRNDHLLFAYFGISIQARQRRTGTLLRSRLAMKRRLVKNLGDIGEYSHKNVLLRDANSTEYPHPVDSESFRKNPRWRYYRFYGHLRVDYLAFVVREYWAWVRPDEGHWDAIEEYDQGYPYHPELSGGPERRRREDDQEEQTRRYWLTQVPEAEQAHLRNIGFIHYDRVIVVDELGDQYHSPPHVLVDCARPDQLFDETIKVIEQGYGYNHRLWHLNELERVALFPSSPPHITHEEFSAALERRHQ